MKVRGHLFWKYVVLFVTLVSGALLTSGLVEIYFSYQENKSALIRIQREKAEAAASKIEQFINEIERQIGWTIQPRWSARAEVLEQRRFDYLRLLRQVPAITEVSYLDPEGKEQLRVSRLAMDVVGSQADFSKEPKFVRPRSGKTYFSPVYFRKESEPYMTMAIAEAGEAGGVTVAEVNLKFIWDVISQIKVGKAGQAYLVDSDGHLIAHPDISLVLQKRDLASLPQFQAARAFPQAERPDTKREATIVQDLQGRKVLTAHAPIVPLGWLVFVDLPVREAFAPIYSYLFRTAVLLLVGLGMSVLASLFLARKMVMPIKALQAGAARIGAGALDQRIEVRTGDELEALADEFNTMTAQLQESYANLEHKVEERTRELAQSVLRITALHDTVVEQSAQLKVQLETATKVQSLFWPEIPELEAGGHIWGVCVPATYVSGDLYDVIPLRDESLLAYVADVSDKGVPAALVMAALSTRIRSEALLESEVDRLLESVNNSIYSLASEEGFFATIVLARYWPSSGKMQLTAGGHLQPLWIVGGNIKALPQLEGISLGVIPDARYEKKEIVLSPGESILFFTDGVVEAENDNSELLGNDRLVGYIGNAEGPPWGMGVLDLIRRWRGNSSANDDLTILEIWRDQ